MGALIPTVCAIAFYMFLQMTVCQPRQSAVKVRPWRFFILMSAGLLRIGEASNPGPPAHFDEKCFTLVRSIPQVFVQGFGFLQCRLNT